MYFSSIIVCPSTEYIQDGQLSTSLLREEIHSPHKLYWRVELVLTSKTGLAANLSVSSHFVSCTSLL